MLYAIRAIGSGYIKFGRANSVGRRLKEIETGCPHELEILAVADWHDGQEKAIHAFLSKAHHRLEWFKEGEETQRLVEWMRDKEHGLSLFQAAFVYHQPMSSWRYIHRKKTPRAKLTALRPYEPLTFGETIKAMQRRAGNA